MWKLALGSPGFKTNGEDFRYGESLYGSVAQERKDLEAWHILKAVLLILRRLNILLCRVAFYLSLDKIFRNIHMYRNLSFYIQFGSKSLT